MAGHSKWANRVHRKSRQDAKRGKLFGKLSREIIVATRLGGTDPDTNNRLRIAIQSARDVSMPNDNIDRAVKRGSGDTESAQFEEINYEGFGPGGAAMLLECMTDNRTRTVAEVRKLFDKSGGNLGEGGSVGWMFEQKGVLVINKAEGIDGDELFMVAVDAGAEDVADDDEEGYFEVTCEPMEFSNVRDALAEAGHEFARAELTYVPTSTTPVPDDRAKQLLNLIEALDDHDDVQKVHSNFEVSDEVLASLEA